jgi:hypothetical protein
VEQHHQLVVGTAHRHVPIPESACGRERAIQDSARLR